MEPAELYARLKALISEWPAFEGRGKVQQDAFVWLGRVHALVAEANVGTDAIAFGVAMQGINTPLHEINVAQIKAIIFKTLAAAEAKAPAAQHGAFIAAASPFQVFAELVKIVSPAASSVLFVDPYVDAVTLTDVVTSVAPGVQIQLLGDSHQIQKNLTPAVARWRAEYGHARPLEAKLSTPRALHDRLVIVDDSVVWSLTQSIKDFAKRSPGSIEKTPPELAALKVHAYRNIWAASPDLI